MGAVKSQVNEWEILYFILTIAVFAVPQFQYSAPYVHMLTLRRLRVDHPRKSTRPKISAAKPKRWNRPLAEGVLPAYDEALKLIKDDSSRMKKEAENIGNTLANAEGARNIDENTLNALRERLKIIKVQSGINLPNVRWLCANGMGG